jgi:hypothetical protein
VSPNGSTASGTGVTETLNLNLSFPPSFVGTKYYWQQIKDQSNATSNWQQIGGSVTINPPSASVQLTVSGRTGTVFQVGDTYTVSITGPPNQAVTVSLNGGAISAPLGYTNGQGIWSTSGTWGAGDVGDYTETWYVGSVAAVPGLSFQVSSTGAPLSCGGGFTGLGYFYPSRLYTIGFTASGASSVAFNINGANTNPYTTSLTATRSAGSTVYNATLDTSALLVGPYSIAAVIRSSDGTQRTCNKDFFDVQTPSPNQSPQQNCALVTGTWTDSIVGDVGTWNLTDTGGTITGWTTTNECGTVVTWNVSGSYTASTQNLSLTATNGSPSGFICYGGPWHPADHSFRGPSSGVFLRSTCGRANNLTFTNLDTGYTQTAQTLTASERIPAGETTTFAAWADIYGTQTAGIFFMAFNVAPGDPAYNFGGRAVQELNPTAGDTLPAGFNGSDTCYWSGAPWPTPFTSLASTDTWYVQSDGPNGSYGPDYVGVRPIAVGWIQNYSPAIASSGSCRIQYPQKMVINKETPGTGTQEPYGAAQTGLNLLVFTFTLNSISVARGSASQQRAFYY